MILLLTVRDPKNKFCIDEIPVENSLLSSMYWMPKMHKKPIKPKFLIVSLKFSKTFSKNYKTNFLIVFFFTGIL